MAKVHVTICVDADVLKKHKARGSNVSDLCNTFLANYGQNIEKLKERAIIKTSEIVEALEGQKLQEARDKELKVALVEAGKHRADNPNKTNLILRNICERFGLDWADAVRRMERV